MKGNNMPQICWIILSIVFLALLWVQQWITVKITRRNERLAEMITNLVEEGQRLEAAAIENDASLREGLDDQAEVYEAMLLDAWDELAMATECYVEDIGAYEDQTFSYIEAAEKAHKFHDDHCLPVLERIRLAFVR